MVKSVSSQICVVCWKVATVEIWEAVIRIHFATRKWLNLDPDFARRRGNAGWKVGPSPKSHESMKRLGVHSGIEKSSEELRSDLFAKIYLPFIQVD